MSARANYFKIGLFVIVSVAIIVAGIVVLGAGSLFKKQVYIETAIQQSVQGLDVGAAVKFRGVPIGAVDQITLVGMEYETEQSYVLVRSTIDPLKVPPRGRNLLEERFETAETDGLRIRMASSGLTGAAYLEIDLLDPEQYPALKIDWKPKYAYIPSAPSVIASLSDSLQQIMRNLERLDLDGVATRIEVALDTATTKVADLDMASLSDHATNLLAEVRKTNEHIDALVQDIDVQAIIQNTSETVAMVKRVIAEAEAPVSNTLTSVESIATKAEKPIGELIDRMDKALESIDEVASQLADLSERLPDNVARMQSIMRRLDEFFAAEEYDMKLIVDNLRAVSENLRDLTENAKRYPSQVLFGAPPTSSEAKK